MTFVITELCVGTKDTSCAAICPVDCIHPTKDDRDFEDEPMLYIDPAICIDCGLCVDVCPVRAIFPEDQLPEEYERFIKINADYYTDGGPSKGVIAKI